ncbi:MAG TPA: arylesterase [Gemmatimonadaceae bacterium]
MKKFWIVVIGASAACQPERNMNGGAGAKTVAAESAATAVKPNAPPGRNDSEDSTAGKVTVLFFGTSLTAGYGLDPSQAFSVLIAAKSAAEGVPITAVNAGLSGETSAGAVRRIEWVLRRPVDVVVLETGGNDALRALDAGDLKANLLEIVDKIRKAQPHARILLAAMEAPPNLGVRYTASFHEAYTSVAKSERLTLLPFLLDKVAGKPELNQDDGVHPNVEGERIVADNVWRGLKPTVDSVYSERGAK